MSNYSKMNRQILDLCLQVFKQHSVFNLISRLVNPREDSFNLINTPINKFKSLIKYLFLIFRINLLTRYQRHH